MKHNSKETKRTKIEEIFHKYYVWFVFGFAFLFLIKSVQSCNRANSIEKQEKKYVYIVDSLNKQIKNQNDSLYVLNFKLKLFEAAANSAMKRADDIKEVAGKISKNTTVKVVTTENKK